jgi:hypothetical protein
MRLFELAGPMLDVGRPAIGSNNAPPLAAVR